MSAARRYYFGRVTNGYNQKCYSKWFFDRINEAVSVDVIMWDKLSVNTGIKKKAGVLQNFTIIVLNDAQNVHGGA